MECFILGNGYWKEIKDASAMSTHDYNEEIDLHGFHQTGRFGLCRYFMVCSN